MVELLMTGNLVSPSAGKMHGFMTCGAVVDTHSGKDLTESMGARGYRREGEEGKPGEPGEPVEMSTPTYLRRSLELYRERDRGAEHPIR
jgi:hypothetical protein